MIQNTFAALITANQEGLIIEFNLAAERLTGFSREEALCRLFEEIVHLGENPVPAEKEEKQPSLRRWAHQQELTKGRTLPIAGEPANHARSH